MKEPLYKLIASQINMAHSQMRSTYALEALMKHMPSGSGIDAGTKLLLSESSADKLVFFVEFHHMDSNGSYCGWSSRKIVVSSSLVSEFTLDVEDEDYSGVDTEELNEETGETYDDLDSVKESTEDYICQWFDHILREHHELTLDMFEPTKLCIHGELVRE